MKTIKTKLEKAGIITKAGKLNDHYAGAIINSRKDYKTKKLYTFEWRNKGRAARDTSERLYKIIQTLGYQTSMGNDAPKGGREGDYIQLSPRAFKTIVNLPQTL